MRKLTFAAAAVLLSFTGAAAAATVEVFDVYGEGINFSDARKDAESQARVICNAMGGQHVVVEVVDTANPGGRVLLYGLAQCHIP
ncbi:hypothetical protein [Stenotrophomonas sp.]|uniref:hypothetical protein n=1 Tax=Stenotrophomonas sp. TaxID=69392 RepID=UPI00334221CD